MILQPTWATFLLVRWTIRQVTVTASNPLKRNSKNRRVLYLYEQMLHYYRLLPRQIPFLTVDRTEKLLDRSSTPRQ